MLSAIADRTGQLRLPIGQRLAGAGIDQVEADPAKLLLCRLQRAQRLVYAVRAAKKAQRLVIERLDAQRGAIDPGGSQIGKARRLDRGGVGLQRDLDPLGKAPMPLGRVQDRGDRGGRHQRGRAAAEEDRG